MIDRFISTINDTASIYGQIDMKMSFIGLVRVVPSSGGGWLGLVLRFAPVELMMIICKLN